MSEDAAQRFMAVSVRFSEKPQFAVFRPSVLYALAAPSTPESVIDKAVAKAESGEKVSDRCGGHSGDLLLPDVVNRRVKISGISKIIGL